MTENRRVVVGARVIGDRLPEWASAGVVILEWLRQQGRWEKATELLKVQREGGYAGVDALLLLIYYFASGLRIGVKEFSDRAREQHARLAAVGGRRRLPTQSSMSRILTAVESDTARSFGNWLLQQGPGIGAVLQHSSVLTRDARGKGWHVFDWDPTVTTLRHRALPELEGTPQARRRSESIAAPGYPGRKRGEVQFSRATLQHAGSGLWLGIEMGPGNGALRQEFQRAVEQVVATCEYAGVERDRAVLRADGAAGNVPFITACVEAKVHYITRLAHYQLLQDTDIVAHLNEAGWYDVPSSGSGPTRQACDLGCVQLEPAPGTVQPDERPFDPIAVRVVVSRFPSRTENGHGAGVVINGWQYELYGTDLAAEGWPEAELVAGYYGRTGQENRFHQEDRELGLDRIFSYHLPGQQLATLVGLFVWNFQICRGMELAGPPQDLADQPSSERAPALQCVVLAQSGAVDQAGSSASTDDEVLPTAIRPDASDDERVRSECGGPGDDVDEPSGNLAVRAAARTASDRTGTRRDLIEAMDVLSWDTILQHHPGWSWSGSQAGLHCPGKVVLPLTRIEHVKGKKIRARFQAPSGACTSCALREGCIRSNDPNYHKDVRLPLPSAHAATLRQQWLSLSVPGRHVPSPQPTAAASSRRPIWRLRRLGWKAPPLPSEPPPLAVVPPALLPAQLRRVIRRAMLSVQAHVQLQLALARPFHSALTQSAAERQQRRLSWEQRLRWNALPTGSSVELSLYGASEISKLLDHTASAPANTA